MFWRQKKKAVRLPDGMEALNGCRFRSADGRITVTVTPEALRTMLGYGRASSWQNETGGILLGQYEDDYRTAAVLDVTGPPAGSSWGRTWFSRGGGNLDTLLEKRWQEGIYYLGEWHTHPHGSTTPSSDDLRTMRSIAAKPSYACPEPILLILSGSDAQWTLNAVVLIHGTPITIASI